jgi:hypothetical protein
MGSLWSRKAEASHGRAVMATLNQSSRLQTSPQDLKIGLFMPCYIDLVYPEVGIATLELLEKFGLHVDYPLNQTCCGQPMSNSGDQLNARGAEQLFVDIFKSYDCIIGPAGSCVKQVRCHYDTLEQTDESTFASIPTSWLNSCMTLSKLTRFPGRISRTRLRFTIAAAQYEVWGLPSPRRLWARRSIRPKRYCPKSKD